MICAAFYTAENGLAGFTVSGHSGWAPSGEDIVCAAVSSAVYMVINTLSDVCHISARIQVQDGFVAYFMQDIDHTQQGMLILKGLRMHLKQLAQQFPAQMKTIDFKWRKNLC